MAIRGQPHLGIHASVALPPWADLPTLTLRRQRGPPRLGLRSYTTTCLAPRVRFTAHPRFGCRKRSKVIHNLSTLFHSCAADPDLCTI